MGEESYAIKLARVSPLRLGEATVDPPRRRVSRGQRSVLLEPRVMEVLVLPAQSRGVVI